MLPPVALAVAVPVEDPQIAWVEVTLVVSDPVSVMVTVFVIVQLPLLMPTVYVFATRPVAVAAV